MILGLSLAAFTNLHVVISLVAIAAGLWLCTAMINGRHLPGGAAFFLIATALTSITGYFFPNAGVTPGQIVGGISLVALALAAAALYAFELRGYWRAVYIIGSVLALYLNVFVGIVQSFQKIGPLARLAPTQSEPPFVIAQVIGIGLAITAGWLAFRRFRRPPQLFAS